MTQSLANCLRLIREHCPALDASGARLLPDAGQFNTVLCLGGRWIFRFPKSPGAAADLDHELEILPRLRGRLPLPIPDPVYQARHPATGLPLFMGYAMLPGQPLLRDLFDELRGNEAALERIALDLAGFLKTLHGITPDEIGLKATAIDSRGHWGRIWRDTRDKLFPHMRPEARASVRRDFESALGDDDLWTIEPRVIHGDFGTGNILFAGGRVSGVIDFAFCNVDDPAQDLGALLASYGEAFVDRVLRHYPGLRSCVPRARFYRSAYALIQALYALRDDDPRNFEDGIAAYR